MGNISVDYDVLNQKGSPAWYSDLFANIPTPGYKGRMFISTDTFAFYRDNGVGWDLVGGPGTGTITGAGVFGQVTFFSGTDTISGNTDFVWDNTNKRLGINTGTPGAPLDIHSTGTAAQFNGTTTNNAFVLFQNAGTSKWRIGNLYNSGANDYQIYDVLNATARLTIKNTGATTLTGTFTATSLIKSGGTSSQILLADGTTTPTSTFGAGSVTNVSAITLGTSGTDLSSSVANSTTTPVITLNVPTASATNRGALSSADWTTFNNKQATITLTTTGSSGAATLVGATLNIPNYTNVGTVTSVAALTLGTSGTDLSSSVANSTSTPVITLNVPTASATNRGALSSADFTTFNNKQATISVTAPVVLTGATISMPAATTSVNGYLTSTDWNTFNNKTSNLGTVTDVVALTIGTTGIDITSTAVTTTTTPVITLNIPTASASNRGALSSTDWTTFNNKQATLSLTTTGTSGAATLIANTLNIPNYGSGAVTGTGTTNYLPKFTGTSTIGNSQVFDNGTSVVIGGTSGVVKLNVLDSGNTFSAHFSGNNQTNGVAIGTNSSNEALIQGFTKTFSAYTNLNINKDGGNVLIGGAVTLTGALGGTSATFTAGITALTSLITGSQPTQIISSIQNNDPTQTGGTRLSFKYNGTETGYIYNRFNGSDFNTDIGSNDYIRFVLGAAGGTERIKIIPSGSTTFTCAQADTGAITGAINVNNSAVAGNVINAILPGTTTSGASFYRAQTIRAGANDQYLFLGQTGNGTSITTNKVLITTNGAATFSADATINSLTIGKGNNSLNENTAIGVDALKSNTTGNFNTGVGNSALYSNTTGTLNNGIGSGALFFNTTGVYNTADGASALGSNTTGGNNTAVGAISLGINETGSNNTAIGQAALNQNLSGQQNTAVGSVALTTCTGSNNIGVGYSAGSNITTGTYNSVFGSATGITTGSYNTMIGIVNTLGNTSNNIVLADGQGNIKYNWDGTNNNFYGNAVFSATINATGFKTSSGNTGSALNATNYGIINVTSRGIYTIFANLPAGIGTPSLYTSSIEVLADSTSARIINPNNATSLILSLSGTLVSVLQSSGGTQGAGIDWSYIFQPY